MPNFIPENQRILLNYILSDSVPTYLKKKSTKKLKTIGLKKIHIKSKKKNIIKGKCTIKHNHMR